MRTITTVSGRTAEVPEHLENVVGLNADGRIVVDPFDARNATPAVIAGHTMTPYMFALTLCCNAYDKGTEDGAVCRGCYGSDGGEYMYRAADGTFPGLDPIEENS